MTPVPSNEPGVYVVSLSPEPENGSGLAAAPIDLAGLEAWLLRRPGLSVHGRQVSADELARHLAQWWLPETSILYIGKAEGQSLRNRISQYYRTPLGAKRPHAGGYWLKTLRNLDTLHVHFTETPAGVSPGLVESDLLNAFLDLYGGPTDTHPEPNLRLPWANLEIDRPPPRRRRDHGLPSMASLERLAPPANASGSQPAPPAPSEGAEDPIALDPEIAGGANDLIATQVKAPLALFGAVAYAPTIATRSYYSTHMLAAAEDAADAAKSFEQENSERNSFSLGHRGYVVSAIVLATAFMEATINEVFKDAHEERITEKLDQVPEIVIRGWATLWRELEGVGTLGRYQLALLVARRDLFDKGAEPWQSARILTQVRNALVHFEPQTVSEEAPRRLAAGLSSLVSPNPFSSNRWDLDGWLSANCASWAVFSAQSFVEEFAQRSGVRPNYMLTLNDLRLRNP
jgi:hypothetical protein